MAPGEDTNTKRDKIAQLQLQRQRHWIPDRVGDDRKEKADSFLRQAQDRHRVRNDHLDDSALARRLRAWLRPGPETFLGARTV